MRTLQNYDWRKGGEPISKKPSVTVPDQSMTIREILTRFTRGQSVPTRQPIYDGEEMPDLNRMDLSEIKDMRDQVQETLADVRRASEAKRKEQDKAAIKEAILQAQEAEKKAAGEGNQQPTSTTIT